MENKKSALLEQSGKQGVGAPWFGYAKAHPRNKCILAYLV